MSGVMFTVELLIADPTLSDAAQELHVQVADLDPSFGVVLINPRKHLYTVLVRDYAASSAQGTKGEGPYSNPGIGLYGPTRSRS